MEVWEKMNYLIAEREMSKKEFINKLLDLKINWRNTKLQYNKWLLIRKKRAKS